MIFCDSNTSSYKINVVKFVIFLVLINKKSYMNSELKKKKQKTKAKQNNPQVKWVKTWDKNLVTRYKLL